MRAQQADFVTMARQDVQSCLATLRSRAMMGARAKPTVAELNNMLLSLENAERLLKSVEETNAR